MQATTCRYRSTAFSFECRRHASVLRRYYLVDAKYATAAHAVSHDKTQHTPFSHQRIAYLSVSFKLSSLIAITQHRHGGIHVAHLARAMISQPGSISQTRRHQPGAGDAGQSANAVDAYL